MEKGVQRMYYKNVYKYDEMKRAEHMAVRETFGWYYWTHHLVEVKGPDAAMFLDKMMTGRIADLKIGGDRYTMVLNEKAEILDDTVVLRMEDDVFWISTLFPHKLIPHLTAYLQDAQVELTKITAQWDMYAVQGPRSLDVINALVKTPADDQKFFTIRENEIDGIPVKINRAGFTGEKLGYEIYVSPEHRTQIEEKLRTAEKTFGGRRVTEFQVMAWTLPTEAGFYYMRDLMYVNPFEVGMERGIGWEKDFVGREALEKIRDAGARREMVGFTVEEADIQINGKHLGGPGDPVLFNGEEVGRVSKIVYGYVKDTNIGYILAQKGALKNGDRVMIHGTEAVICDKYFL